MGVCDGFCVVDTEPYWSTNAVPDLSIYKKGMITRFIVCGQTKRVWLFKSKEMRFKCQRKQTYILAKTHPNHSRGSGLRFIKESIFSALTVLRPTHFFLFITPKEIVISEIDTHGFLQQCVCRFLSAWNQVITLITMFFLSS